MNTRLSTLVLPAVLCVSAAAQPAGVTRPTRPTTRPATTRAAAAPEVARNVVDPYDPALERERFFQAAGVDNELDRKEFDANREKTKPFVRKFDRWEALAAYDKDANKTIDWFEADAYRRGLRSKVLAAYDTNKDGRLLGQERHGANAALAGGRLDADLAARATSRPAGRPTIVEGGRRGRRDGNGRGERNGRRGRRGGRGGRDGRDWRTRYDTDGDGQISAEEREAMVEAFRRRGREARQRRELEQFDADKDGQLNEAEQTARDQHRAERQRAMAERRRQWVKMWDTDGDGELSEDESSAMRDGFRQGIERFRREADVDGDGETTREEMRAHWRKIRARYDADGDGELNDEESRKMIREGIRRPRREDRP